MVVNGTLSTNEGEYFISQIEVETDQEPTQLADRHSELAVLRQQGTTAKSTHWGGDCLILADFAENTKAVTATQVAAREEAAIGKHRQGTTSTDENKQYDPGGTSDDPLISAYWPCCILYALLCVFLFCFVLLSSYFPMISYQVPLKMREIGTCKPEEQLLSWQWIISVHDQKGTTVASRFSLYVRGP